MEANQLTKARVLKAISTLTGKDRGVVVYLADELGICPQAVSRWKNDKPIPRVHRLHLKINRPDVIELLVADVSLLARQGNAEEHVA